MENIKLRVGDISANGQVEILAEDKLCYLVKSISRGAVGIRTISKDLLDEYVQFFFAYPNENADNAREVLKGRTQIDNYEYGYSSTLTVMAKMVLDSMNRNFDSKIIQNASISSFAYDVFRYLEGIDNLKSFVDLVVLSEATNYNNEPVVALKSKYKDEKLVNLFIEKEDKPSQTYYYNEPFNFSKKTVYLNNGWATDNAARPDLTLKKLAIIVNESYGPYIRIIEKAGRYELQELKKELIKLDNINYPLQQIYYGAPGTGKSHTINKITKAVSEDFVYRTTFHPDSDYSTFVGAYKPTMEEVETRVVPVVLNNGAVFDQNSGTLKERKICYKFVPQTFIKAYVKAWQNPGKPVYLVIEEINRGNCAQIFGDLFQLLDRGDNGESEYPIKADQDIKDHLAKAFAECEGLKEKIKSGDELVLPSNLYIWATMNTSDQSLFPIDSAFKRRWDWQYMPIDKGVDEDGNELKWSVVIGEKSYDWWDFLEAINDVIGTETSSEDKKLGFFFCKADSNDEISVEKFVNKVLFYLWNDVFKTCGVEYHYKDNNEDKLLTFDKFYKKGGFNEILVQNWLEQDLGLNAEDNPKSNDAYAETKEQRSKYAPLYADFWTKFLDYAKNQSLRKDDYIKYFDGRKTPTQAHWYTFTLQKRYTLTAVQLRSQNKLSVGFGIPKTDDNIFGKLKEKQVDIENDLGIEPNTLVWDEDPKRKNDGIIHRIDVVFDESKQKEQFDWIIERLLKMREVFSNHLELEK
ncbi:MAG: DUF4268 domain-containing protein [Paludibacteraceae bacterium]|nr:DUF4268 domain-containing protein [Paludibacteraceae bacterium]MBR5824347.1 DUF4268 domain-containing protein [Paludibacteraceae bacterium]